MGYIYLLLIALDFKKKYFSAPWVVLSILV